MEANLKARRILTRMQRRAVQADRLCSTCDHELVMVTLGIEVRLCAHTLDNCLPDTATARRDEKGCGAEGRRWKFKPSARSKP